MRPTGQRESACPWARWIVVQNSPTHPATRIHVAIEIRERAKRGEARGVVAGKRGEIEDHPARQRREHARGRRRGPRAQRSSRASASGRRASSSASAPLARAAAGTAAATAATIGRRGLERGAQGFEMREPRRARISARVGDGVGGAREQVRESDGLAEIARKDPKRKVEAPADAAQEAPQQVGVASASRSRSGASAGRASPSLS